MNEQQLLSDAKAAMRYLDKIIKRIEGPKVSFIDTPVTDINVKTILGFIEVAAGNFAMDILSSSDMCETLNDPEYNHLSPRDPGYFTPVAVGRTFVKLGGCSSQVVAKKGGTVRICIIRNHSYYEHSSSRQLYEEYVTQKANL